MENRIIEKIQKMLALANNESATEGERDNALRMAWGLIRKHNLDIETIQSHSTEEARTREYTIVYGRPWAKDVCMAVAKLFFCKAYFTRSKGLKKDEIIYSFIGKESNAITSKLMCQFLIASIRKEASKQMRAKGEGAAYRRSFAQGAANTLWSRVNELQAQSDASPGTSLTVIDVSKSEELANVDFIQFKLGIKLKSTAMRASKAIEWDAYVNGVGFGKSLPLNTQVDGSEEPELLT